MLQESSFPRQVKNAALQNAPECSGVFQNAPECSGMLRNAPEWRVMARMGVTGSPIQVNKHTF